MTAPYSAKAIEELLKRTEYEAWLLEEVCKIVDLQSAYEFPDAIIYPLSGESHTYTIYGKCNITE